VEKSDFGFFYFARAGLVGWKSRKGDFYVILSILVSFAEKNEKF